MVQNDPKWTKMVQNGPKWSKMAGLTLSGPDVPARAPEGREGRRQEAWSRGGNQMGKSNFSIIPKWILLSFQYIITGEKEFLNLVTVLTLHIDRQIFENHYVRVKNKSCRRPIEWPIKTSAREALSQWRKNWLIRTYQFGEKFKNHICHFLKKKNVFFFSLLVC